VLSVYFYNVSLILRGGRQDKSKMIKKDDFDNNFSGKTSGDTKSSYNNLLTFAAFTSI